MTSEKEIILCADGSSTLRSSSFEECYHSVNGALAESVYIFIINGLIHYLNNSGLDSLAGKNRTIKVFEAGFGTGLNALLTAMETTSREIIAEYTAVELFPLSGNEISTLNHPLSISKSQDLSQNWEIEKIENLSSKIINAEWNILTEITPHFSLKKIHSDILSYGFPVDYFDIVYYDMFSPSVQPQVWGSELFKRIFLSLKPGGIFITYSSKGSVKSGLREAGFIVNRLKGPTGKRHIIRALRPN